MSEVTYRRDGFMWFTNESVSQLLPALVMLSYLFRFSLTSIEAIRYIYDMICMLVVICMSYGTVWNLQKSCACTQLSMLSRAYPSDMYRYKTKETAVSYMVSWTGVLQQVMYLNVIGLMQNCVATAPLRFKQELTARALPLPKLKSADPSCHQCWEIEMKRRDYDNEGLIHAAAVARDLRLSCHRAIANSNTNSCGWIEKVMHQTPNLKGKVQELYTNRY